MTAGHGALYYSIFAVSIDAMGNETVTGGSIHRAIVGPGGGARHPRLAGAPGAAFLAQAAGRVTRNRRYVQPCAQAAAEHSGRDDHTGALAWSRPVTGTIEGLAISRRMVVALVGTAGDQAIRIYRPATGRLVAIIDVHQGVIAVACRGTHLAFAKARRVFLRRRSSTVRRSPLSRTHGFGCQTWTLVAASLRGMADGQSRQCRSDGGGPVGGDDTIQGGLGLDRNQAAPVRTRAWAASGPTSFEGESLRPVVRPPNSTACSVAPERIRAISTEAEGQPTVSRIRPPRRGHF